MELPPNSGRRSGPPAQRRAGFTLIEVVLAILIVATVMVPVLALLTSGMELVGEAGKISTQGRIGQGIVGELQLAEWDQLDDFSGDDQRYRYYDEQGQELAGMDDPAQVYVALIQIGGTGVELPGTDLTNPDLRIAQIFIAAKPGARGRELVDQMASDPGSTRGVSVHSRILVRMDKAEAP